MNSASKIGGYSARSVGNPVLAGETPQNGVCFGGERDGVVVAINPLDGQYAFTVQVLFKPLSGGAPKQQFLHLEDKAGNRVMMETRLANRTWYLHTFLKSGEEQKELETAASVHPADQWYWAALTYADGEVHHYLNGEKEASAPIGFEAMTAGEMAIGTRLTEANWFKGCVKELRFANAALPPGALAHETSTL